MNAMTVGVLVTAGLVAIVDWVAVTRRPSSVEVVAKPLVLALLIVAAITLDPADNTQRAFFVAALVLSLTGDAFLLPQVDRFVLGLGAFLLAHVAYVGGFVAGGIAVVALPVGVVIVSLVGFPLGRRLVRGARDGGHRDVVPVVAYVVVISVMVVAALASENLVAISGALLFMASDALIGWSRFVRALPHGPLAIMVTYHLAEGLLVVSLAL